MINSDKVLHFFGGQIVTGIFYALFMLLLPEYAKLFSMVFSSFVAYGKERWDAKHAGHTSDGADFVAHMCGAACFVGVL